MAFPLLHRVSSFTFLNVTQFLGALNDNIYKLLIVYFFIQLEGIEYSHQILATTGAIFVLPFLLFSAASGTMADRFSKRDIIVLTKILELVIMGFAVLAFSVESKMGSYIILFLLATQSAIFGPSKYGIVPELVTTDKISKANGLMTSFTFLAIILGTFLASFLIEITNRNFILASIFCTFIALIGLVASFCIEITKPSGSTKRVNALFLKEILDALRIARNETSLFPALLGSSYFLFLGAFVQLNMIPFAVQSLGLSDVQGGYLFLLTALGIGMGSIIAGKISGKIVELGLVPIGGLGIILTCYLIDLLANHLVFIIPLVVMVGMFGGIYQIPLDSYIQVASPKKHRGQMVAATNFLSFIGVLFASILIYVLSEVFGLAADKGFTIIGSITIIVTIFFSFQFFDYVSRFVAMLISRIRFHINVYGKENIPECPAVYVCSHTAWNDALLLMGSQRRRMRFFIKQEQSHSKWMKKLYRLLRVVFIPDFEPLEKNEACLHTIKETLKKGISVCIFVDNIDVMDEIEKLNLSCSFRQIIEEANYPIIPVAIDKKERDTSNSALVSKSLSKFRSPAKITFGSIIYSGHQSVLQEPHELCICDSN